MEIYYNGFLFTTNENFLYGQNNSFSTSVNKTKKATTQRVKFSTSQLESGVYFVQMNLENQQVIRKLTVR